MRQERLDVKSFRKGDGILPRLTEVGVSCLFLDETINVRFFAEWNCYCFHIYLYDN